MIRRTLTRLRWNLTIRWRLYGGEWYPFRGVPDDVVQRWAVIRPNMREDQVDVVLKARDELEQRANRWVPSDEMKSTTAAWNQRSDADFKAGMAVTRGDIAQLRHENAVEVENIRAEAALAMQAARRAALEEAARLCDAIAIEAWNQPTAENAASDCADAIRAMSRETD